MDKQQAKQPIEASISAVITRADGTVEDLGRIAYTHPNALRRFAFRAAKRLGRR